MMLRITETSAMISPTARKIMPRICKKPKLRASVRAVESSPVTGAITA